MSVFSIYEKSQGQHHSDWRRSLAGKLKRWEKFDGRVLDTLYAEPVGLDDARTPGARHKYPALTLRPMTCWRTWSTIAKGSVRRVNNNLRKIFETAPPRAGTTVTWRAGGIGRCSRRT
jgi:hypothetical protein